MFFLSLFFLYLFYFRFFFCFFFCFFFSSRRRHTRCLSDWSSDVALPIFSGSGPGGRIVASDIKNSKPSSELRAPSPVATGESKSIPLTAMRRTIAKRLSESDRKSVV